MRLDPLIEALTAGTARQGTRPPLPSPLAEAMLEAPDASPSLRLLYAAGVRALEHTIGRLPSSELPLPAPAELDPRPPCRPRAAALVQQLLSGSHDGLLPETLERIHAAGQRLPHALLPLALGVRRAELRAKVRPLLGPRGRWLAAHSPSFAWALEVPSSLEALARAWAEGTAAVRRDALDKGRRLDAGVALSWLIDTWAHEKADDRAVFVGVLEVGLSPADEPFLERALDDRSAKVRSGAAQLLARLPSSTFVARMKARAVGALQLRKQQLVVHDPQPAPRDGLPEGAELRGLRLAAVLAAVSPADEARRLGLSAEALLALARRTTDLSSLAEGWSRAAVRLGDAEWALALWATWATADDKTIDKSLAGEHMQALLGVLPAEQAAGALSALLERPALDRPIGAFLVAVPTPWPSALAERYLAGLTRAQGQVSPRASELMSALAHAVRALSPADLARYFAALPADGGDGPWRHSIAEARASIALRRELLEETRP